MNTGLGETYSRMIRFTFYAYQTSISEQSLYKITSILKVAKFFEIRIKLADQRLIFGRDKM
jgi:hypothetical protein